MTVPYVGEAGEDVAAGDEFPSFVSERYIIIIITIIIIIIITTTMFMVLSSYSHCES